MSVGIVVVSHSAALAQAALELAAIMVHRNMPPVALASGMPGGAFGTDTTAIMTAIEEVGGDEGVVILADMGSAILSAETAVDLLAPKFRVEIAAAPIVEGLTASLVSAAMGESLDDVLAAAESSLGAKLSALGRAPVEEAAPQRDTRQTAKVELNAPIGLHARPASRLASLVSEFDADVSIGLNDGPLINAKSTLSLMALGATQGDTLRIEATGPEAARARNAVVSFIASGLGE